MRLMTKNRENINEKTHFKSKAHILSQKIR